MKEVKCPFETDILLKGAVANTTRNRNIEVLYIAADHKRESFSLATSVTQSAHTLLLDAASLHQYGIMHAQIRSNITCEALQLQLL